MARRRRTTENSRKDGVVVWEMLEHVRRDDRSTTQVVGNMKREGKPMLHGLTCWYVRADGSGKPAGHYRHGMKYGRPDCTVKAGNVSVKELHGKVFVDRGYIRRELFEVFYGSRQL